MINFILGGLFGIGIMCLLQINRDNKAQRRINKAIKCIDEYKDKDYSRYDENEIEMDLIDDIREILGGKECQ
jgi:hypothetical protein